MIIYIRVYTKFKEYRNQSNIYEFLDKRLTLQKVY